MSLFRKPDLPALANAGAGWLVVGLGVCGLAAGLVVVLALVALGWGPRRSHDAPVPASTSAEYAAAHPQAALGQEISERLVFFRHKSGKCFVRMHRYTTDPPMPGWEIESVAPIGCDGIEAFLVNP